MFDAVDLSTLVACVNHRWSPQIGDPTIVGWGTVGAYALCAVLGFTTLLRVQDNRERIFWGLITLAMLFLGVNKELDLQSMFRAVGRCLSQLQGWYEERQAFKRIFIIGFLMLAGFFLAWIVRLMSGRLRRNGLALLGLTIVTAFVAVRAAQFQQVGALINSRLFDIRFNVLFELSGLVAIGVNAIALLATRPKDAAHGTAPKTG